MFLGSPRKIHSVLCAIFTYALAKGDFPGRSDLDNPAYKALIPPCDDPQKTVAASADAVKAMLAALENDKLARAAVALPALTGVRPGEALGFKWEDWSREDEQLSVVRAVWHGNIDTTKTDTERYVTVTPELRTILLDLWNEQGSPIAGFILDRAGSGERKNLLENLSKRNIAPVLKKAGIPWHGFYSLRRFHGTAVRKQSGSSDTMSKALGNSKEVADKHYLKPDGVLPDVRKAVNAMSRGLA